MTISTPIATAEEVPDCEEVLASIDFGEPIEELLERIDASCDPCELAGCEDFDPEVSIVAMAWSGVDDPMGFPDVGVLRTNGCGLDDLALSLLLHHEKCTITYDSILWPGEFAANCTFFGNDLFGGTLTYFAMDHFCNAVVPSYGSCVAGTTGGSITLGGEKWRGGPQVFGNGNGVARC